MGFVQSAGNKVTSNTALTVTLGSASTLTNCLFATIGSNNSATGSVSGITIGGSADNWASAVSTNVASTDNLLSAIWSDQNVGVSSTSVIITISPSGATFGASVIEWAGIAASSALDKTHTGTTTSGAAWSSGSSGTLTNSAEVAIGTTTCATGAVLTITGPSSPWTNTTQEGNATGVGQLGGYQQVSATTALTYNGTQTNTTFANSASCIATFKIATASTASPFTSQIPKVQKSATKGSTKGSNYFLPPIRPIPAPLNIINTPSKGKQKISAGSTKGGAGRRSTSITLSTIVNVAAHFGTVTIKTSEATAAVAVAPHFGSLTVNTNGNVAVNTVAPHFGTTKVIPQGITATVSQHAIMGTPVVKLTGQVSTVNIAAFFGHISEPKNIFGLVSQSQVLANPFTLNINKTETPAAVIVTPNFGKVTINTHGLSAANSSASHFGTIIVHPSIASNTYINAEFGSVHAGWTVFGLVSTDIVASHFGGVQISLHKTANMSASSVVSIKTSVTESPANVSISSHFGTPVVSPKNTAQSQVASHLGTPKISPVGRTAAQSVKAIVGVPKVSVSATVGVTAQSHVSIQVLIHNELATATQAAVFGSLKVSKTVSPSNVSALAQKQGTNVGPITAHATAVAYPGTIHISYTSKSAAVQIQAHVGIAGQGKIVTGPVRSGFEHSHIIGSEDDDDIQIIPVN